MNTAVRVFDQNRFQGSLPLLRLQRPKLTNIVLITVLLISAFTVLYIKDMNRRLFIEYQDLQSNHDKLYQEWGKLLLEQSTWATQARVQKIAQSRLGMSVPSTQEVTVLRLKQA